MVFFYSLNVNLPRASSTLGLSLSSLHVKTRLVYKAFSPDLYRRLLYLDEMLDILHTEEAIAELQTDILASKWMTFGLLMRCMAKLLERPVLYSWLYLMALKNMNLKLLATVLHEGSKHLREGYSVEDPRYRESKSRIWDLTRINLEIQLSDCLLITVLDVSEPAKHDMSGKDMVEGFRPIASLPGCRIPEKLLRGPWTDENCMFLEMVMNSGASVDWIGTATGEVVMQGLHLALRENNYRAVRNLIEDTCNTVSIQSYFQYPTIGAIPRTEDLRTAVIDAGCHVDIVQLLLRAPTLAIDFNDPELLAWAVDKQTKDDLRGSWLLHIMCGGVESDRSISYERFLSKNLGVP